MRPFDCQLINDLDQGRHSVAQLRHHCKIRGPLDDLIDDALRLRLHRQAAALLDTLDLVDQILQPEKSEPLFSLAPPKSQMKGHK
jgi:hypothetical protein